MKIVGVFTATHPELSAIRRLLVVQSEGRWNGVRYQIGRFRECRVILVHTGVGRHRAEAAAREALSREPIELAISSGFAGALTPAHIGDLLIGTEVMESPASGQARNVERHTLACDPLLSAAAFRVAQKANVPAHRGRIATVPHVVWRATDKRDLAADTGGIGLDMESATVGALARDRQVPFLVVRAVSDLLDEDLPMDFNLFLAPARWPRAATAVLTHPSSLLALGTFRQQVAQASQTLTRFYQEFFREIE